VAQLPVLNPKERGIETGLDYFGARYFSSPQGRFTSVDPITVAGLHNDPQSWNGYVYARNNPLVFVVNMHLKMTL
jgi:RHS repeat-associated protein